MRTGPYEDLGKEIDVILEPIGLRVVEISVRRASKRVMVDVFLAKIDSDVAKSPDTADLEAASAVLHVFFEEHFRDQDFFLTLSSPGLDRRLKTLHEFELFRGRAAVVTYLDAQGISVSVSGSIGVADGDCVELLSGDDTIRIPVDSIRKACLEG